MKSKDNLKEEVLENPQPGDQLFFDVNRWHTVTARHGDQLEMTYQKRGLTKVGRLSMDIEYFRDAYSNCMKVVRASKEEN